MMRQYSPGWIYFGVFVAVAVIFAPAVYETNRQMSDKSADISRFPQWSYQQIMAEMVELEKLVAEPVGSGDQYIKFLHRMRFLEGVVRRYKDDNKETVTLASRSGPLTTIRYRGQRFEMAAKGFTDEMVAKYLNKGTLFSTEQQQLGEKLRAHVDANPKVFAMVSTPTFGLARLWGMSYLWAIPIIGIFFIVRLGQAGFNLGLEFMNWLKPVWATILWPVAIWWYPNDKMLQQQVISAMRFATYALSALLSFGFGGAAVKAAEKNKAPTKEQGYTLQIDTHHGEGVNGDPPDPQEILRLNLRSPGGHYGEILHIEDQTSHVNIVTFGSKVADLPGGALNAYGGLKTVTEDGADGSQTVLAGVQAFTGKGRFSFVMPIAQIEREISTEEPVSRLTSLWIASMRLGKKTFAGIESFMQASSDGDRFAYAGPVVGFSPTPSLLIVGGCYRDTDSGTRCRAEMMHTITW